MNEFDSGVQVVLLMQKIRLGGTGAFTDITLILDTIYTFASHAPVTRTRLCCLNSLFLIPDFFFIFISIHFMLNYHNRLGNYEN